MITVRVPEPGQLVRLRTRLFVVVDVQPSTLPPPHFLQIKQQQDYHYIKLVSVDDDTLGEELEVIWELEVGAQLLDKMELPNPEEGSDPPKHLEAFLNAIRWDIAASAEVQSLQAPFRAAIEIQDEAYQLEPLVRALQMPRINLLIADDVGLGKTIEAGLICLELVVRHRARRILIVCPSSLQIQWKEQMWEKFGLDFRIVDRECIRQLRRKRGLRVNPWTHYPRLITSIDFIKKEHPMRLFKEALPGRGNTVFPRKFDLLIVDEAHLLAPSGKGKYATDSLRTKAIRTIAPHFEHKLFLTATPHNGYLTSFTALLEILDNQRFWRVCKEELDPEQEKMLKKQLSQIMVRRMKSEIPPRQNGTLRFPKRTIEAIEVEYTEEEKQVHHYLQRYGEELRKSNVHSEQIIEFVLKILKKRLFSSPESFATTLEKHYESIMKAKNNVFSAQVNWQRKLEEVEEDYSDDIEKEEKLLEAMEVTSRLLPSLSPSALELLNKLRQWADKARFRPDSKAQRLLQWLEKHIRPCGHWTKERVIIFTEYRTTQKWLYDILASQGFTQIDPKAKEPRLLMLYGGMPLKEREKIKAAFQASPDISPVRILLATDAASEGIDLQNHCCRLIHYEIPWNPNRMEQRNGRIDRHGQRFPQVFIYHFVPKGYQNRTPQAGDLAGDLEFLYRVACKMEKIQRDLLGKASPVLATQVEEAMVGKRTLLDTEKWEKGNAPEYRILRFERKIQQDLQRLHNKLKESQKQLQLTPENLQKVVEIGLKLAGKPPLMEATLPGIWPDPHKKRQKCPVFYLPKLDGSWKKCLQGLRHPYTGQIRPITFDPAIAHGRDDVVLIHLNHHLVQLCLKYLRAEIWSQGGSKKLHRVCYKIIPAHVLDTPAVLAYGRLVILGNRSHKLHEEILFAGGTLLKGKFSRIPQVGKLKEIINSSREGEIPSSTIQYLTSLWPNIQEPLRRALERRTHERTASLQNTLARIKEKEKSNMKILLKELEKSIQKELAKDPPSQLELFPEEAREQLRRNRQRLERRLKEIPTELEQELQAIEERFSQIEPRLFPLAVTFFVPENWSK